MGLVVRVEGVLLGKCLDREVAFVGQSFNLVDGGEAALAQCFDRFEKSVEAQLVQFP